MEPARWERLQELFDEAAELAAPAQAAFLEQSCPDDPTLRRAVQSLLLDLGRDDAITSAMREELAAPAAQPGERIGPYRLERELGRGGMGEVYLAVRDDAEYHQRVAVKLLRGGLGGGELLARFRAERQILASLEHPNIARLLDGGRHGGLPYLVMEYVEGQPITEHCARLRLDVSARLRLFREVCAAVQYAHQNLVVHRDIKPSNVLVSTPGVPKLLDFGIAKLLRPDGQGAGATRTYMRLMTPEYASPEQILGGSITTASDVYSLGVLLYELLTGRRPHEVDSAGRDLPALERLVCEREPSRPSLAVERKPAGGGLRRQLRGDLDNIVLKALEREPERRYASAEQLSEDLRRHLDGEGILARPPGTLTRLVKRARRHRGATAAVAATAALALVFAALGLAARASARAQAQLAAEFGQSVKDVEWLLRVAHMAPAHDVSPERAQVRERLAALAERMRDAGSIARGPGEYAQGRGELALGRPGEARRHLEAAWRQGYRTPDVAYALGLALGTLYQSELQLCDSIGSRELREARRREIQAAYRDPAVSYLRQSAGGNAVPDYVQGLLAFYEKRYDEALARAEAALRAAPWLYEARLLAGDVSAVLARERHDTGDEAGSQAAVRAAEASYRAAAAYARSDATPLEGLCQVGVQRMEAAVYERRELGAVHAAALSACQSALQLDPARAEALARLANVQRFWARHLWDRGEDPSAVLEEAARAARRAIALDPRNRRGHGNLGVICRLRAEYEVGQGRAPDEWLRQALESLQTAVELSGADAASLNDLANAYTTRALATIARGGDPAPDLDAAIQSYDRALERVPDFGYALANRGDALLNLARFEIASGRDPRAHLATAAASLSRAAALLPRIEDIPAMLVQVYALEAEFRLLVGEDASPALERARESLRPLEGAGSRRGADTLASFGCLALREAQHLEARGLSARQALAVARERLGQAVAADPGQTAAVRLLAETELVEARSHPPAGPEAEAALARAARHLDALLRRAPRDAEALALRCEVERRRAERLPRGHRSSEDALDAGLAAAERSLAVSPGQARALAEQGVLLCLRAERAPVPGRRLADARQAEQALRRALELNLHLTRLYGPELERARALVEPFVVGPGR